MQAYIEYGLESRHQSTQFGSLNALPHLFVRQDLRAENLGPLIEALGRMLLHTQTAKPHLFYPVYVALERLHSLLGFHRFYRYLLAAGRPAVQLYETVQKRAPSPSVFQQQPSRAVLPPGKYSLII